MSGRNSASSSCITLLLVLSILYSEGFVPVEQQFAISRATLPPPATQRLHAGVSHRPTSTLLHAKSGKKKKKPKGDTIAVNRLAYRNYDIVDTLEAGISLKGSEVSLY